MTVRRQVRNKDKAAFAALSFSQPTLVLTSTPAGTNH